VSAVPVRAVVAGEALVDLLAGPDGALHPHPGGGPFNAARAMVRLGLPTAYLGRLSTDRLGRLLQAGLRADGVDLSLVRSAVEPTTLALAELDPAGAASYRFYVQGTSAPLLSAELLPARLDDSVAVLHLGTLGLLLEPMADALAGLAVRERGQRLLMLDLNIRAGLVDDASTYRARLESLIAMGAVVQASDADLAWLRPGVEVEEAARCVLAMGARLVLVTLGSRGALAFDGPERVAVAAPPVQVVDTVGAGDAFGAAFLAWLHRKGLLGPGLQLEAAALERAVRYAVTVASITCTRAGADPPREDEVPADAG
jgi:fructokinase